MSNIIYMCMSIIESILTLGIGLSFVGVNIRFKRLTIMGIILTASVNIIRFAYTTLNIPLGTHSFLILIVQAGIILIFTKQSIYKAIIATLISYLILILLESVLVYNFIYLFKVDISNLNSDYALRSSLYLLTNVPLSIIFYFVNIKGLTILKQSKEAD